MNTFFAETLKNLRTKKGLSQNQLASLMFVNKTTISKWESGSRLPDAAMMTRLSKVLEVEVGTLLSAAVGSNESPNVIMVDDSRVFLSQGMTVLEEAMPNATIMGFVWPQEAIEFAKANPVALAILDIEMGTASGLDLCRTLLEINPGTNVVFLTAYPDYSLDAWKTGACGFLLKPLTLEDVREQLGRLRYPFSTGGPDA